MTTLPRFRTRYGEDIGIELYIGFPDLAGNEKTYFDADEAAGQTTLSASGTNFAANDYVVLGPPGVERTEIVLLSGASATTLTSGATVFAHLRGEPIRFIPYNQIVVERSTDGGTNFSALTAVNIRPDASETYIQRATDASTDVYRFRFYNSTSTNYSAYSDSQTASGLADNTAGSIKRRALSDMGEKLGDLITDSDLNTWLSEARRKVDEDVRAQKFSFRTSFNTDIGNVIPGRWLVAAPSDLRDRNTNKNVLSLRVGRWGRTLDYEDFNTFIRRYENIAHTTLASQCASAATSATLTSSGDFDESGAVTFAAEDVSGTLDTADYTANNESTNVLSGMTGVTDTHAAGRDVWQAATFGNPRYYTIWEGNFYFELPFSDDLAGENIYCDYYKTLTAVNSDADVLDEPQYDLYVNYLKFKIKNKKANGELDPKQDGDFLLWLEGKDNLINSDILGQEIHLIPSC